MTQTLFLQALRAALLNQSTDWQEVSPEQWQALFSMAESHQVLPLVYQAVAGCPAAAQNREFFAQLRGPVFQEVAIQTRKTAEFYGILKKLQKGGVHPLIVKGVICRSLYPNPDLRPSSDEDLWICTDEIPLCREILAQAGMVCVSSEDSEELAFGKRGSPLYLEVHEHLFPSDSAAYGDLNELFRDARENAVTAVVDGVKIPTLSHTDHLFYLILHAFKHFLHSGFGLRQVADVCMYANAYGQQVDWAQMLASCRRVRAHKFAAAMLKIGEKCLTFSPEKANLPACWQELEVDEGPMLRDLLQAGVFGDADQSRIHSSTVTLSAVTAQKTGGKASLRTSLFPSAKSLEGRYPYLRRNPWLLPAAWTSRIFHYLTDPKGASGAGESLRLGQERVEMFREYDILDS